MKDNNQSSQAQNQSESIRSNTSDQAVPRATNHSGNNKSSSEAPPKRPLVDEFGNPLYHEHDEFGEWLTRDDSEQHHHPYGT